MEPSCSGSSIGTHSFSFPIVDTTLRRASSSISSITSGASLRRLFSLPTVCHTQMYEDAESKIVSQAGDIGNRALDTKESHNDVARFSTDGGIVYPIPEEFLASHGFGKHEPSYINNVSPVSPLIADIVTPTHTDALLQKNQQEERKEQPPFEYIACLVHLAVFGILGALTRYLLQKLFGPSVAHVTSDQSILYLDLPSNMVGSFLMGWIGVVFKPNISHMSDQLAIGLSTGYLGSLTTFSGWNQKMVELSAKGNWVFAVVGYVLGLFLAAYSIIFGVETAKGFKWLLKITEKDSNIGNWRLTSSKHHLIVLSTLLLIWGGLWSTCIILELKEFKNGGSNPQLWLGCLVAPFGVWIRWWLARLNGSGIGRAGWCKWIPTGTLIVNVLAACIMAALAIVKKVVNTKNSDTIATGLQFGLMGCLSTVSTFMAEFNAMRLSNHPWRAYIYALITISISFGFGTLIYSMPIWTQGYIQIK